MRAKGKIMLAVILFVSLIGGCGKQESAVSNNTAGYKSISMEEAVVMMEKDDGHLIVDVRTAQEYNEGHIPGAVNLPNENVRYEASKVLTDPDQILLVYCRTGRRSKEASEKLSAMGYTNVYEIGGINSWTGSVVTGQQNVSESFLIIEIDGKQIKALWEENSSAKAFRDKLQEGAVEVVMHDYGNFEKVGPLPWSLPDNDSRITTVPGDVILYQGDQITIYYDENTWTFTKMARIEDLDQMQIREFLGDGQITVTFRLGE